MTGSISPSSSSVSTAPVTSIARTSDAQTSKPSLTSIERNYQVAEEKSVDWSPLPFGLFTGTQKVTKTEAKMLDRLALLELNTFKNIKDEAFSVSKSRVPPVAASNITRQAAAEIAKMNPKDQPIARAQWPTNDGHTDAFRHAFWNARLTAEFGVEWATQFATAHEGNNTGSSTREAMDLYNNEVGRQIAVQNPNASSRELADLVKTALDNGQLVVIDQTGHLEWSNNVANGYHGHTIQLPGVDYQLKTPTGSAAPAS